MAGLLMLARIGAVLASPWPIGSIQWAYERAKFLATREPAHEIIIYRVGDRINTEIPFEHVTKNVVAVDWTATIGPRHNQP